MSIRCATLNGVATIEIARPAASETRESSEALPGGRGRPRIEHDRLPAELAGEAGERHRVAAGPGENQLNRRGDLLAQQENLAESRHHLGRAAVTLDALERIERRGSVACGGEPFEQQCDPAAAAKAQAP
mgnify:CR=1 FL=1